MPDWGDTCEMDLSIFPCWDTWAVLVPGSPCSMQSNGKRIVWRCPPTRQIPEATIQSFSARCSPSLRWRRVSAREYSHMRVLLCGFCCDLGICDAVPLLLIPLQLYGCIGLQGRQLRTWFPVFASVPLFLSTDSDRRRAGRPALISARVLRIDYVLFVLSAKVLLVAVRIVFAFGQPRAFLYSLRPTNQMERAKMAERQEKERDILLGQHSAT